MKKILDLITAETKDAFSQCGYDETYAKVTLSNRPDLCGYQCNGAMAAAKAYKKKPIDIANEVVAKLEWEPITKSQDAATIDTLERETHKFIKEVYRRFYE